jgi:hypothetical protein
MIVECAAGWRAAVCCVVLMHAGTAVQRSHRVRWSRCWRRCRWGGLISYQVHLFLATGGNHSGGALSNHPRRVSQPAGQVLRRRPAVIVTPAARWGAAVCLVCCFMHAGIAVQWSQTSERAGQGAAGEKAACI